MLFVCLDRGLGGSSDKHKSYYVGQGRHNVPRYLDVHKNVKGVKLKDVAEAHAKDLKVQGKYGVNFQRYWLDEKQGTIFCLSDAPNKEAIAKAHKEAHGLLPSETFEVQEGS